MLYSKKEEDYMKKRNSVLVLLLIIAAVAILSSGITYLVMKGHDQNEESDRTDKKLVDGINFLTITDQKDKIVESFEITLNGKTKTFEAEFSHELDNSYEVEENIIKGNFNKATLYERVKRDGTFTKEEIKNNFNEKNFQIIGGVDGKKYLLVESMNNLNNGQNTSTLLVYNDELELISDDLILQSERSDYDQFKGFVVDGFFYDSPCDTEQIPLYSNKFTKVENDKIYFLLPKLTINTDYEGILEERVYTIKDDKLQYSLVATHKISKMCQQSM